MIIDKLSLIPHTSNSTSVTSPNPPVLTEQQITISDVWYIKTIKVH